MKVILVRHGHSSQSTPDELRSLSENGRKQVSNTGSYLKEIQIKPTKIVHSDLSRAKETAFILKKELNCIFPLEESTDLRPESNPIKWYENLYALSHDEIILFAGHMPYMGDFTQLFCHRVIAFPTAGCIIFENSPNEEENWKMVSSNF